MCFAEDFLSREQSTSKIYLCLIYQGSCNSFYRSCWGIRDVTGQLYSNSCISLNILFNCTSRYSNNHRTRNNLLTKILDWSYWTTKILSIVLLVFSSIFGLLIIISSTWRSLFSQLKHHSTPSRDTRYDLSYSGFWRITSFFEGCY